MKALLVLALATAASLHGAQDVVLRTQALESLRRGVGFFRTHVSVEGTYLWQYSEDLSAREGETKATATQAWVQPPGTPAVGQALLSAWTATSNRFYLDAARETAHGLMRGQLRSGGWTYSIHFEPQERRRFAYRESGGNEKARNVTTLDDDTTQAALRFLMRMDEASNFQDRRIREAIDYAVVSLLKAQYPNGAWPQGYDQFPVPGQHPVKRASFPETWPRIWPGSGSYWLRYTLNDNALATMIDTLLEAERIYGSATNRPLRDLARQCRSAAEKAGDFIILAQMPEPQPAWAQQYDFDMHPSWARKFEPPSVTGGESQGALRMLLKLYRETGQRKYLEPVPRALAYLRRSRLPDGRLARFYELQSNQPLYFTRDYALTNDDSAMPTHYAFKVSDDTAAIAREFDRVKDLSPNGLRPANQPLQPTVTDSLIAEVKAAIASQDSRGRWLEAGRLRTSGDSTGRIIRCATFNRNVEILSRYLAATRP